MKAIPSWMAWTQLIMTALTLLVMISVPLFALAWLPRKLSGRIKGVKHLSARVWPLAAVLAFDGFVTLYFLVDEELLGKRTPWALAFTACTLLFALFSFVSLLKLSRVSRRQVNLGTYLHTLLASAVLSVVALYLLYWGIIGFRPWAGRRPTRRMPASLTRRDRGCRGRSPPDGGRLSVSGFC